MHMPRLRSQGNAFDERERRGIQPLQVVEEDDQRFIRARERADEALERRLEAQRGLCRAQGRQRRLRPHQCHEFGKELEQQAAVASHGVGDAVLPARDACRVADQDVADQSPKGLCGRGVGGISQALIEFAGDEDATRCLEQFLDNGGLADACVSGDEREFEVAAGGDPLDGPQQGRDLRFASVELLGHREPTRYILHAKTEWRDPGVRFPFLSATSQVGLETCGRLVAILAGLGEKLHHDGGQRGRHRWLPFGQMNGLPCNVAMDPFKRIGRVEGQQACQHLVEHDAQRIEIAARVDGAVHAPGLFGRHVGRRAGDHLRRPQRLAFALQPRRKGEAGEPRRTGVEVDEHVAWFQVPVHQARIVRAAQGRCDSDGDLKECQRLPGMADPAAQQVTLGITQPQRRSAALCHERKRPRRPSFIEQVALREFPFQALQGRFASRILGHQSQHRRTVGASRPAVQGQPVVLSKDLECLCRRALHGHGGEQRAWVGDEPGRRTKAPVVPARRAGNDDDITSAIRIALPTRRRNPPTATRRTGNPSRGCGQVMPCPHTRTLPHFLERGAR